MPHDRSLLLYFLRLPTANRDSAVFSEVSNASFFFCLYAKLSTAQLTWFTRVMSFVYVSQRSRWRAVPSGRRGEDCRADGGVCAPRLYFPSVMEAEASEPIPSFSASSVGSSSSTAGFVEPYSARVVSWQETNRDDKDTYILYELEVRSGNTTWTLYRRYFLHQYL